MASGAGDNPLAGFSQALVQAVEKASGYVVLVDARKRLPASGVIYTADLVLTADHAVQREENIRILLPDGGQVEAALAGRDPSSDLALLRVSGVNLTPAHRARGEGSVGQLGLALARPSPEGVQAGLALISAVGGPVRTRRGGLLRRYFRLDATPYPGFSGGALVDPEGSLLGINTSGLAGGVFLSIPAGLAWETAEVLAKHGRIKRGYLGIRSQPVELPVAARQELKREQATGLLLLSVDEGSPAGQGGLMVGDILVAINSQPITDPDELVAILAADMAGKSAAVEVLRGGKTQTLTVVVGEQ